MAYSEEELIEELKRVSEEHCDGEAPTTNTIDNESFLEHQTLCYRYNESWAGVLDRFGIEKGEDYWDRPSGEKHHWWKEGTTHEYGSSWPEQRGKIIQRDGYRCRVCRIDVVEKWNKTPSVHHITPRRYWDVDEEHEKMNREGNLISLCPSCHQRLEGKFMGREHDKFECLSKEFLEVQPGSIFEY